MNDFIWRKLKTLKVPEPPGSVWTPALDYILVKRIYRITATGQWKVGEARTLTGPDGIEVPEKRTQEMACPGSAYGALIAKVGGSTAGKGKSIFAVGRHCVFQLTDELEAGPLYLGANETAAALPMVTDQLDVLIEIAL